MTTQQDGRVRRVLSIVLAGLVVLVGLGWVSVASVRDVQAVTLASESTTSTRSGRAVRVAVVGDSLSAGRSRSLGNGLDDETWMTYADGDGIEFAGGWARAGARPEQMAAAVRPVGSTDVLVVLAGTNAVLHEETVADVSASYEQIVATIGASRVLVSAIPPCPQHADAALVYNQDLRAPSEQRGCTCVDRAPLS